MPKRQLVPDFNVAKNHRYKWPAFPRNCYSNGVILPQNRFMTRLEGVKYHVGMFRQLPYTHLTPPVNPE